MAKQHFLISAALLLLISCKEKNNNTYDAVQLDKLNTRLFLDFTQYEKIDNIQYLDFIKQYSDFCGDIGLHNYSDYIITQAITFSTINSNKRMSYEVVNFFNGDSMKKAITAIQNRNCIEDFNLRINKIYVVNPNTIVILNSISGFEIDGFENAIKNVFGEKIRVYEINQLKTQ